MVFIHPKDERRLYPEIFFYPFTGILRNEKSSTIDELQELVTLLQERYHLAKENYQYLSTIIEYLYVSTRIVHKELTQPLQP